ncbi:MAG: c-type cytochrome [Cyclobacteriaceae bacterium]
MKIIVRNMFLVVASLMAITTMGQKVSEETYYRITTVPIPEGIQLEGGGVEVLPDGSVGVATRRGDVWIIENPTMAKGSPASFRQFATGLHEPLGLAYLDGALYTAQRGELTKLIDEDGDRKADVYETVYSWPLSAHYHEYSFGPVIAPDTTFFVTANVAFGDEEWWRGESRVLWRGWTMRISRDGTMEPWATGMRSPAGFGLIDGEFFYTDNQGDWIGSGALWHVPKGAFIGHPGGLRWTEQSNSPVKLTEEKLYAVADKRQIRENGVYVKPDNIPNEENPDFVYEMKEHFPEFQLPAVILPHGILGISNSQLQQDATDGKFGPFEGQIFIGDQGQSKIMRVVLEKVNDQYQGVAFDFRAGFQSGVMRMDFDNNGNLFVGETNRGWGSAGTTNHGLQYVTWTGKMPFEMKTVKAKADGFEITFTKPVDKESAKDLDTYNGKSYIYKYHPVYGSPQTNIEEVKVKGVKVSDDGLSVRLVTDDLRQYYVHEFFVPDIKSAEDGQNLLHKTFYYTLNNIPEGEKLAPGSYTVRQSSATQKKSTAKAMAVAKPKPVASKVPTYDEIEPLLVKNTCVACHQKDKRVVGPSFAAISKRRYTNEKIVELIYNPEPKNWPEYATPMAPMPQVDKKEALKIAAWINSLKDY